MTLPFILHFHLGPVQAFIGEARRTRDIWAGSFLLSWLSAEAMNAALGPSGSKADIVERVKVPVSFVEDPIFAAVRCRAIGEKVPGQPFCGTFPNHFSVLVESAEAGIRAENRVRECWIALGQALENMLFNTKIGGRTLGESYPEALNLFRSQIGIVDAAPMWEILTVLEPYHAKASLLDHSASLDARKAVRWSTDIASVPATQMGALCSMLPGWPEISAIPDAEDPSRDNRYATSREKRAEFWKDLCQVVVAVRYGEKAKDRNCLDIVPKERLSAPALVKRLFPLLPEPELAEIIGWVPSHRSASVSTIIEQAKSLEERKSWISGLLSGLFRAKPAAHEKLVPAAVGEDDAKQNPMLWPSTSYIAAAHWIERVHRSQPVAAGVLQAAIERCGPQYALAEQSVFINCTVKDDLAQLAAVDGACLFESSLERLRKDNKDPAFDKVKSILADLARKPIDEDNPALGNIGRPSPVYAVVRADGDQMGKLLFRFPKLSSGLGEFTSALRGGAEEHGLGVIYENNGITIYASADEMIAMCPVEDAFKLAKDVRRSFREATAGLASGEPDPTISVAITLAHRQVPLSWVMQAGTRLLDGVAKDLVGGDSLAIEIMDTGGRRNQWAAWWPDEDVQQPENDPLSAMEFLITEVTSGEASSLASNQFMHDFAVRLEPLLVADDDASIARRIDALLDADSTISGTSTLAKRLLAALLKDHFPNVEQLTRDRWATALITISETPRFSREGDKIKRERLNIRLSPAGLKVLRLIAENWRKLPEGL